jgi:hypothetical protein
MACLAAIGLAYAFGNHLNAPLVGRQYGQDAVSVAIVAAAQHNCMGAVDAGSFSHEMGARGAEIACRKSESELSKEILEQYTLPEE